MKSRASLAVAESSLIEIRMIQPPYRLVDTGRLWCVQLWNRQGIASGSRSLRQPACSRTGHLPSGISSIALHSANGQALWLFALDIEVGSQDTRRDSLVAHYVDGWHYATPHLQLVGQLLAAGCMEHQRAVDTQPVSLWQATTDEVGLREPIVTLSCHDVHPYGLGATNGWRGLVWVALSLAPCW